MAPNLASNTFLASRFDDDDHDGTTTPVFNTTTTTLVTTPSTQKVATGTTAAVPLQQQRDAPAPKIRCAILGCGMMGQEHISYLLGYPEQVSLEYLCDPHEPSLQESLRVWKAFQTTPPRDEECCSSSSSSSSSSSPAAIVTPLLLRSEDELWRLASDRIDLLVLATPNYLHTDALLRWWSLDQPVTILCEKPVAVSWEQYQRLSTAAAALTAAKRPPRVWIGMEYRYIPAVQKLITLIPDVVGDIRMITIRENRYPFLHKIGNWNRHGNLTGDTLVEKCCHFFDLFRLISRHEVNVQQLQAMVQRGINYGDEEQPEGQAPIIDSAYVMFPFATTTTTPNSNGGSSSSTTKRSSHHRMMGCLELCMFAEGSRHQEEIIVTGSRGRLEAYLPENKVYAFARPNHKDWSDRNVPPPDATRAPTAVYDCSLDNNNNDDAMASSMPTHSGYHYSSTAVEWYKLLQAMRHCEETGEWKPEVSLHDGLEAVRIGLEATTKSGAAEA